MFVIKQTNNFQSPLDFVRVLDRQVPRVHGLETRVRTHASHSKGSARIYGARASTKPGLCGTDPPPLAPVG